MASRQYELKLNFEKLSEQRASLMSICGGLLCKSCGYANFTSLALSGGLKFTSYYKKINYYLTHTDEAQRDLTVLCYNCLMWKRNSNKRTKMLRSHNKSHNKQREQIFHILTQFECQNCGGYDRRFLEIDHIKGLGSRKVNQLPGGAREERRYYIKHPKQAKKDLQILCSNCNHLKKEDRLEYGLIHV